MSEQEKLAALATPLIQPPLHKRFVPAALANRTFREMVRKSGQMGVPVIDVNGKVIVGFNKPEIERALRR